jgi:hypothetical protein
MQDQQELGVAMVDGGTEQAEQQYRGDPEGPPQAAPGAGSAGARR